MKKSLERDSRVGGEMLELYWGYTGDFVKEIENYYKGFYWGYLGHVMAAGLCYMLNIKP